MNKNPFDIVSKGKRRKRSRSKLSKSANTKESAISLENYTELSREKWNNLVGDTYIRWIWKKSGKLDKGGWVRWSKVKRFDNNKTDMMIAISANYGGSGGTRYDRIIYGSKIKMLYAKKNTGTKSLKSQQEEKSEEPSRVEIFEERNINITPTPNNVTQSHYSYSDPVAEIKENLEVTSEIISMQMELNKVKEENDILRGRMDKINGDMEDLVGFIKKEVDNSK